MRRKITYVVLACCVLAMLTSQVLCVLLVSQTMHSRAEQAAHFSLAQGLFYVDEKMNDVAKRLFYTRVDPAFEDTLTDLLMEDALTGAAKVRLTSSMASALAMHRVLDPLISSLYLYTPGGSYTDMVHITEPGYSFEGEALYRRALETSDALLWGEARADPVFISNARVVPVVYRISIAGYPKDCFLLANLSLDRLTSQLNALVAGTDNHITIVNAQGRPVTNVSEGPKAALLEAPLDLKAASEPVKYTLLGKPYLVMAERTQSTPWTVVCLQSMDGTLTALRRLILLFALVSLLLMTGLSFSVFHIVGHVVEPLRQLSNSMKTVEIQHSSQQFAYDEAQDEIVELSASYNSMVSRTKALLEAQERYIERLKDETEKARISQLLKRRAELKALQAQINPHFLYNTLESIRWKADEIEAGEIVQMTTALATLFRIGISRGFEIIPIRDEMLHTRSYLEIQKLRYGDRLDYGIEIDPELEAFYTVKLLLQPLVENAIYHGVKELDGPGMIRVQCRSVPGGIAFAVEDNGVGIPPQRLEAIRRDLAAGLIVSRDGYGIYNVQERIRLYFGEDAGLTIESATGVGTRVSFTIPVISQEEVKRYVPAVGRG